MIILLKVRDGSATEFLKFDDCSANSNIFIASRNRWLWVQFKSNYQTTNTGFFAQYSVIESAGEVEKNPWPDCQRVSYSCPNKECIETAYRCDGQNDCGCVGDGCDEHRCGGLNWSEYKFIL